MQADSAAFRPPAEPVLDAGAIKFPEDRPMFADNSAVVMLSYAQLQPATSLEATEEKIMYAAVH